MKFTKDFYWGAATSAHQIEGGLINDWVQWEEKHASRLSREGERPFNKSLEPQASTAENYRSNSKYSAESFKYWKRDLQAIKELNLKAYRLSVEWSRIQPEKGEFSKEGVGYYREYLKQLQESGIKVVLTCWHWSIPVWLEQEGGLLSKDICRYFSEYVEFLAQELSPYVDYWITINEPESFVFSYLYGTWPPGIKNPFLFHKVFMKILPKMHIDAYRVIKQVDPQKPVSLAKNVSSVTAYNSMPWNKLVANFFDSYVSKFFLDKVSNHIDYLGINFYFHNKMGIKGMRNDNDKLSDMGWWLQPDKLFNVLVKMSNRYKKPIFVTENGIATTNEETRIWWIKESVKAMSKALQEGVDLIGYLYWSLLDNFEWDKGFWPKFGLVSVDPQTKERKIKEGGKYYSDIIKNNGIT